MVLGQTTITIKSEFALLVTTSRISKTFLVRQLTSRRLLRQDGITLDNLQKLREHLEEKTQVVLLMT
jgi:hypothetical protein